MSTAADRLLEELAEKVDALNEARVKVALLQAEVAQAAARLILETGGEAPALPGGAAQAPTFAAAASGTALASEGAPKPGPLASRRSRASVEKAANKPHGRRGRVAPPATAGAIEPAASALFGGPRPGGGRPGRHPGVPTIRQSILDLLKRRGPMRSSDIVRAVGRDPGSTWRTLRELTAGGDLVRGDGPDALYSLPAGGAAP